jgi:crotonobetainyl-CoA:carnitine CoA-transferase CaiB-like acyl-CoA transferase
MTAPAGPLSHLRVLDFTQLLQGPLATQILADLGADVIKFEKPGGEWMRHWGIKASRTHGEMDSFLAFNRNKRSVVVDLKHPDAVEAILRLAPDADVVVENFRPGVTGKLGVDYETLKEINPRIIYASVSGFGQTGPYATRPGYDLIAQGMSGVMSVTGEPGGPPAKCGVPIGDLSAGLFCAFGILSAYIAREETGRGQYVDTSLFEGPLAFSIWESAELWATGRIPQPFGSAHRLTAPYQALKTRDGYINIGANNQRLWARLCKAIGREELIDDERFATNADRMANRAELAGELEKTLEEKDTEGWMEILLEAGFPAGPIYNYKQVFEDPHTLAREMVVEMEHPVEGTVRGLGIPVKLSETPGKIRRPAPLLGEHTEETLMGLGYSKEEIADLRERGVV